MPQAGVSERVAQLASIENRRDAVGVTDADVSHRAVEVRRAAARALSRIASNETRAGLLKLLSDEDAEVISQAAYGLGWTCQGHEDEHVKALVARAATIDAKAKGAGDASFAVARALGRCGTAEAEQTLVLWLRGPNARPAALGLGDVSTRRKLTSETQVSLVQAAAGTPSTPVAEALYPFTRAEIGDGAIAARVREVAEQRLSAEGEGRIFAIRALGRTGLAAAAEALEKVLVGVGSYRDNERAEAAVALGRLGERAQRPLLSSVSKLAPGGDKLALASLVSGAFGPLSASLEAITAPVPKREREGLVKLAKMALPEGDDVPQAIVRRVVRLRCLAARLLAPEGGFDEPTLVGCDPSGGDEVALARLWVLGQKAEGRKAMGLLAQLSTSKSARVRAATYELVAQHKEIEDVAPLIERGLSHEHAGTVASAAQVLLARADVATQHAGKLEPLVVKALGRAWGKDDTETVAALIDASAAGHYASAKKLIEPHCSSASPTLRAHAQSALSLLGEKQAQCLTTPPKGEPAAELSQPIAGRRVVLDTDVGELSLELEPEVAPTAAARLADLAQSGFFDDMAVHRVVPGFVVQWGDRAGDGTGGAGREPLRCETSPLPFGELSVGVALAGRDTGSSQFFVTLSRTPHLDGEYARVGVAKGDWHAVTVGDRIRKAKVLP